MKENDNPVCCECGIDATHIINDVCCVCNNHAKSAAIHGFIVKQATKDEMIKIIERKTKCHAGY